MAYLDPKPMSISDAKRFMGKSDTPTTPEPSELADLERRIFLPHVDGDDFFSHGQILRLTQLLRNERDALRLIVDRLPSLRSDIAVKIHHERYRCMSWGEIESDLKRLFAAARDAFQDGES